MKRLLPFIILLALPSCESMKSKMDYIVFSWVGSSISEVEAQWGKADQIQVRDGEETYSWIDSKEIVLPQNSYAIGRLNPYTGAIQKSTINEPFYSYCIRTLTVDSDRYVKSGRWEGNNCPNSKWFSHSNWGKQYKDQQK